MAKNLKFQKFSSNLKSTNSYVYTRRPLRRNNQLNSEIFYSLSSTEHYKEPLQATHSANVRDRKSFLTEKYQTKPAERYAFPIATSMRIGWFQT